MLSDESEAAWLPAVTADEKKSFGTGRGTDGPPSDKPGWLLAVRGRLSTTG